MAWHGLKQLMRTPSGPLFGELIFLDILAFCPAK